MKAKKTLGQHFLRDERVLRIIVETAAIVAGETVLEVGPGTGLLTAALLKAGARVVAVEKDDRLISVLENKFAQAIKNKQLELIHADILDFLKARSYKLKADYKLIANIPYYLTGQILRQFLSADHQPQLAVLMLQKEVAERIIARDDKESILSMSVKVHGRPHYIVTVPAGSFDPPPKVDSAIVLIDNISRQHFQGLPLPKLARVTLDIKTSEKKFFDLLKRGFAGKRKMLKNNLKLSPEIFPQCGIEPTARAENLNLNQWLCLARVV